MLDSHCHLTDPRLLEQLEQVLERAASANVSRMVSIGTHAADWRPTLSVCAAHSNVRCALGIHPNYCHEAETSDLDTLRALQSEPNIVALGEMGLDYHHRFAPKELQADFFHAQLTMAAELHQPVVIHCREAVDDCLRIMGDFPDVPAVFHCFTGTSAEASRILDRGYLLGFTGVVTFSSAPALREIVRDAPADRILIETDAPYLSPEPMRKQKINEPSLVPYVAAAIARARGVNVEAIDQLTTANASRFYRWTL